MIKAHLGTIQNQLVNITKNQSSVSFMAKRYEKLVELFKLPNDDVDSCVANIYSSYKNQEDFFASSEANEVKRRYELNDSNPMRIEMTSKYSHVRQLAACP